MAESARKAVKRNTAWGNESSGGQDAQFGGPNCGQHLPRAPAASQHYSTRLFWIQSICGVGPCQRGRGQLVRKCNQIWPLPLSRLHKLSHLCFSGDGRQWEPQTQAEAKELPPGCLSSTGITTLELTRDFQVLGAHACDNCKLLKHVDILNSSIEEIQEFTREVRLPCSLHTIRVEAFMNCAALPELATPPSLHYIANMVLGETPWSGPSANGAQTGCARSI